MKNLQKNLLVGIAALCLVLLLNSCQQAGGDATGSEFMPDMYHSIAYEANYYDYYYYNTWGSEDEYYQFAQPRKPVEGTIARGYAGIATATSDTDVMSKMMSMSGQGSHSGISIPFNGNVPYYYADSDEERLRASREILNNPFPITSDGLARGKLLYEINCGICHGNKGDGNGYLVAEENTNVKYPAQPAILTAEQFDTASNGQLYHAIMYGKNVMGGYADKLSYEERWQVIHYIRALQAKEEKKEYSEQVNNWTNHAVPAAQLKPIASNEMEEGDHMEDQDEEGHESGNHNNDESHGSDGDH